MKHLLSVLLTASCLFSAVPQATAQTPAPTKQWDKTFGGSNNDGVTTLQQTSDGGYILGGYSTSGISGDKSQPSQGNDDYWLIKLDGSGTKQWDRSFGGSGNEVLYSVQQTSDGGYILGGLSTSGQSGDRTQPSQGSIDYWVVKLDASGSKQWDRRFGGTGPDVLMRLHQTSDGGYILGGYSVSGVGGDKTQPRQGGYDYWIVKIDASGSKQWDRTFGGTGSDELSSINLTTDGGYLLGGRSNSDQGGDKTQPSQGNHDYWIVKLDGSGTKQWDQAFGTSWDDNLYTTQQTSDGGYILGGESSTGLSGDKTQVGQGGRDYWVLKLTATGSKQWDHTFGGAADDRLISVRQTSDGGYALAGSSNSGSTGDKTQPNQGQDDFWLVKLDAGGTKQWDRTLGGTNEEVPLSLHQTSDGGYILGGYSNSGISGDKTQANQGFNDYWIVKLGPAPLGTKTADTRSALSAYPNPTRAQLTLRGPLGTPYQLLNQLGQVVLSGQLSAQPLDVQALPAGLYLLHDATSGRTTKLVKE